MTTISNPYAQAGDQEYNRVTPLPQIRQEPKPNVMESPIDGGMERMPTVRDDTNNQTPGGYTYIGPRGAEKDYTWKQDQSGTYQRTDGVDPNTGKWLFPELNQGQDPQAYLASINAGRNNQAPASGGFTVGGGGGGGLVSGAMSQPQTWQVDPSQTVEARASGIINKDGPLMQQARGYAMQKANERGLINSSLGIQASQDAVLSRATDIAKQDAATSADAGKFNVNQANSWNLAQQELNQKNSQFDKDLQYRYDSVKMNADNARSMAEIENKYASQLQSDAAFNSQYRAYVDALLFIDNDKEASREVKLQRKFEQAKILENYARVRGLKLDLNFSSQYGGAGGTPGDPAKPGAGNGAAGGPAGGATSGPPGEAGGGGGGTGGASTSGPGSTGSFGGNVAGIGGNYNGASFGSGSFNGSGALNGASRGASFGSQFGLPGTVLGGLVGGLWGGFGNNPANAAAAAESQAISDNANMGFSSAADSQAASAAADANAGLNGADPGGFGGGFGGFGGADPSGADPG